MSLKTDKDPEMRESPLTDEVPETKKFFPTLSDWVVSESLITLSLPLVVMQMPDVEKQDEAKQAFETLRETRNAVPLTLKVLFPIIGPLEEMREPDRTVVPTLRSPPS